MPRFWWMWTLIGVVLVAGAFLAGLRTRRVAPPDDRLARLEAENSELRARLDQAQPQNPAPSPPPLPSASPSPGPAASPAPPSTEETQSIHFLRSSLAEANASIVRLNEKVQDLEAQKQNAAVETKRLSASEADLQENLAAANRTIAALQKELSSNSDLLTRLQTATQKLREQNIQNTQKTAQFTQLSSELQDVYRRLETYLNSILRRYRDLTEQYRAFSEMLANRERLQTPPSSGADLSRIQNTISLAEEDLRQLDNLNAQALRLQKKLAGK